MQIMQSGSLSFYIPFLTEKAPLVYTFLYKIVGTPFSFSDAAFAAVKSDSQIKVLNQVSERGTINFVNEGIRFIYQLVQALMGNTTPPPSDPRGERLLNAGEGQESASVSTFGPFLLSKIAGFPSFSYPSTWEIPALLYTGQNLSGRASPYRPLQGVPPPPGCV